MNPKTSQDLFNKIRSQFSNIEIGNESGEPTADAGEAVFFDFEFKEDADTFGRVSVSLADGENMKVFYNRDLVNKIDEDSKTEWYDFLKELKDFAVEHQLRFDVRDITKSNLTKQDYQNLADTNTTVNTDGMSEELNIITKLAGVKVKEGMTGTTRSSYENLDKTRLIIRHSGPVDENIPGARSRHISSLYIENEDGERFKYPITHLAGARAMSRHVANGGRPHDEFGEHIIKTSENIAQLNSFSRYVSHKDQLNDNAGDIIEQTKLKLENLRTYMKNLNKQTHYDETFKNFKPSAVAELSDDERSAYREKFTLKNLDDRVEQALPLIHNIMSEYKPEDDAIDAPIEPIVDHGAIVQSFLTNPDKRLILRKDDTADKMLSVTKFSNNNTMLGSILSDIASRMLTADNNDERIANFASRVADGLEREGELFNDPDSDWPKNKSIAIQLARRYIEDYKKMQKDPAYADEVRMDANKFKPKAHPKLDKKARGETAGFEDWVDDTVNPKEDNAPEEKEKAKKKKFDGKFEDIKPFIEQHLKEGGDKTTAIETAIEKFNAENLKESRGKIVESIKSKAGDHAQNIAGIEGDGVDANILQAKDELLKLKAEEPEYVEGLEAVQDSGILTDMWLDKDWEMFKKYWNKAGLEQQFKRESRTQGSGTGGEWDNRMLYAFNQLEGDAQENIEKTMGAPLPYMSFTDRVYNAIPGDFGDLEDVWDDLQTIGFFSSYDENRQVGEEELNRIKELSGIEGDSDRVTGEAGLQIARIKYLSNYQN